MGKEWATHRYCSDPTMYKAMAKPPRARRVPRRGKVRAHGATRHSATRQGVGTEDLEEGVRLEPARATPLCLGGEGSDATVARHEDAKGKEEGKGAAHEDGVHVVERQTRVRVHLARRKHNGDLRRGEASAECAAG